MRGEKTETTRILLADSGSGKGIGMASATKVNPEVASKKTKIRKPSLLPTDEGNMAWRGLTDAT
jgi:hypothetical protein